MRNRKLRMMAIVISLTMLFSGCGNANEPAEVMATTTTSDIEVESQTEEPAVIEESEGKEEEEPEEVKTEEMEEELPVVSYFEVNELEFDNELSVETKAVRTNVNDETDMEVADAVWTLKSITIEEGEEENTQVVTVESECTSYYWTDRKNRQMYSIVLPSVRGFDLHTGECFPSTTKTGDMELGYLTEVTWNDVTYQIDATGHSEWDDGGDWTYDEKSGGYIHPTTVHCENKFVIKPQGYDSLGIVIEPVILDDVEDREDGVQEEDVLIKDVLDEREGCYLYSVMDMYEILNEDSVDGDKGNASTNTETQKDSTTTNNSSTTPKQNTSTNSSGSKENTTPKQEQPTHTHSYTSSVTKNPTCTEEGIRTYTCTCGASYTEAIAKVNHNWQPITESVYHPSTGHYETVTKKELYCNCGATFGSMDELNAHTETHTDGDPGRGVRETSENVWVVDGSEYYSDEVTGYQCSVCGARQ